MRRTLIRALAAAAWLAGAALLAAPAAAQERVGVLMLHGKNPGSAQDPNFKSVLYRLEREGFVELMPDMPWSRLRYLDGDWDQAMQEIGRHVATLRDKGATQVVLMGHSMGVPASMSYAARDPAISALVLFAPGHAPRSYYYHPPLAVVRKSIDEARALVAEGRGDEKASFADINQGRPLSVRMTAKHYLSYFDPTGEADMAISAPKVPPQIPVLTVMGTQDPLHGIARSYFVDKLPAHPKTRYLEVTADHVGTPEAGAVQAIEWLRGALAKP
jgi:pimeloyl-ACP methyl ester carboxylesterase